ncbi:Ddi1p [Dipodascopsis tothii]|uniref:Ddi1p n=1 Tax=Dipodascopsis tothii TaxID=44089 RepID=UPI0034CFB662
MVASGASLRLHSADGQRTMHLIVTSEASEDIYTLEVSSDMSLSDLKAFIEAETGVVPTAQVLFHKATMLTDDDKKLSDFGMDDYDMIMLRAVPPPSQGAALIQQEENAQSTDQAMMNDVEKVRLQMLGDQNLCDLVRQTYPELADSINDAPRFRELLMRIEEGRLEQEEQKRQELKRLNDDPYNEESQRKILEIIQQEGTWGAGAADASHHGEPELGARAQPRGVRPRGHAVRAGRGQRPQDQGLCGLGRAGDDHPSCAETCNVMFLLDRNFRGVARGVGTAEILGRIHSAPLKIGSTFLPCSFTVMEGKDVDLLLGLDMLKRHQATIDLKRNVLVMGQEEVPFLGEADLPPQARQQPAPEPAEAAPAVAPAAPPATAPAAAPASVAAAAPTAAARTFPEADIAQLESLGVQRAEAVDALTKANGNVEIAASLLFM